MRPTPETNADCADFSKRPYSILLPEAVYASTARKLERERDAAREALRSCDTALTEMMRTGKHGWIQDAAHKEAQTILSPNKALSTFESKS